MAKLLTIVVPSYNMERYLKVNLKTLVFSQDKMGKVEILIINDGSTDKTSDIAHEFEKKYPNIVTVIDKKNGNYGSCVNVGLKRATGVFIKILDADDSFNPANMEEFITELENSESNNEHIDMFFTDYHTVDEKGNLIRLYKQNLPQRIVIPITDDNYLTFDRIQHHCIAYRTELLRKNDYYQSERLAYTDQEWITIPLLYVRKIKYIPLDLYAYLLGRSGQTMDKSVIAKSVTAHIKVGHAMLDTYLQKKDACEDYNLNIVRRRIIKYFQYIYKLFLITNTTEEARQELTKFDKQLSKQSKDIYDLLFNTILCKKIPIKYIKYWRQKGYNCLLAIISGVYSSLN